LSPIAIGLLQEAAIASGLLLTSLSPEKLAALVNAVPIRLIGTAPLARAISTAGGVALDELHPDFMVRCLPGVFAAGEMLDWEAPTGGYLLQACFATGAAAGKGALKWRALFERKPRHNPPQGGKQDGFSLRGRAGISGHLSTCRTLFLVFYARRAGTANGFLRH
jgi:hypothetical protein